MLRGKIVEFGDALAEKGQRCFVFYLLLLCGGGEGGGEGLRGFLQFVVSFYGFIYTIRIYQFIYSI